VKEMRVGEVDGFLQELFPFLSKEERGGLFVAFSREFPKPPYRPSAESTLFAAYILIDHTLDRLAIEKGPHGSRAFFEQFSGLSPEEIDLLAKPAAVSRRYGVEKVVNTLEHEAQEMNIGEVKGLISEKFPSLGDAGQAKMIGELTRGIPARQPRKFHGSEMEA
jgi:hypothetical protein